MKVSFNTDDFVAGLQRWQKANQLSLQEAAVTLALNLAENIIRRTPVDTGWARANWWPSINEKPEPPNTGKPNPNESATAGLDSKARKAAIEHNGNSGAQQSLDRITASFAGGKAGDIFTIANGVPYILALEHGHSGQAPKGMVTVSIATLKQFLTNFKMPG